MCLCDTSALIDHCVLVLVLRPTAGHAAACGGDARRALLMVK
jgi:hypothetical protein